MPEFSGGALPADVRFRYGELEPPQHLAQHAVRVIVPAANGTLMYWKMIGTFLVEGGHHVTVSPVPGVDERLVRLVLTGPVLGVVLAQRGRPVFHASVVASGHAGGAIAFMARTGEGKSTMAAAMYKAGYHMLSDDIMPVDLNGETPLVPPGFPHTKLWSETAAVLVDDAAALAYLAPDYDKRSRPITERFAAAPAPLQAVFVLETGAGVHIEKLSGHQALGALLPHWYGALFNGQLVDILGRERHFRETAALAERVPVYRLTRPRCFERLPEVVDAVSAVVNQAGTSPSEAACR